MHFPFRWFLVKVIDGDTERSVGAMKLESQLQRLSLETQQDFETGSIRGDGGFRPLVHTKYPHM